MRALDLDFQPWRYGSRLGWGLLATGLMIGVAATSVAHDFYQQTRLEQDQLSQAQSRLHIENGPPKAMSAAESREQAVRLAEMKQISTQLHRPWERLFSALESLYGEDIALLTLTPDARKGQIRISAQARDLEAMLKYHRQLERSAQLHDVSLLSHEIVVQSPQRPILFNLVATWEVGDAHP